MAPGSEGSGADWKPVLAALAGVVALVAGAWLLWAFLPRDVVLLAALAIAGAGTVLSGLALARARALRRWSEKMSSDFDAVSRRLVRLDADLAEFSRRELLEPPNSFEEITAEIGLLGGLVRDIAVTMAGHEKDLAGLREVQAAAGAAAVPPPAAADAQTSGFPGEEPTTRFEDASPDSAPTRPMLRPEFRATSGLLRAIPSVDEGKPPPPPEPIPIRFAPPVPPKPELARDTAGDAAVLQAFDHARGVELYLQAVVALPQRKLKLYEAQPRLRLPGEEAPAEAGAFLPVLERHGRLADLDRLVLARSAVITRHLAARGSEALVALSLSPTAVALPGFLRAVGQFVEAHTELSGRLILGLSQRCWRSLDAERSAALAGMRERGLIFMLDRAEHLDFDVAALAQRAVRYVKVSAEALRETDKSASGAAELPGADISAALAQAGIALIADGVEREGEVPDLIELGAVLAQGDLFAPPRAVRADALLPPPGLSPDVPSLVGPSATDPGADPASGQAERKPFRAFLRRAG